MLCSGGGTHNFEIFRGGRVHMADTVVKWLVEETNMEVESKDNNGKTALHYAASGGHFGMVKWLVEEVNIEVDSDGLTALHSAVMGIFRCSNGCWGKEYGSRSQEQ